MKKAVITLAVAFAAVMMFATTTYSWFTLKDTIVFPTSFGSSKAAYFASGDGSKENPYTITSPVHFYNFAWLQYLGYFNLNDTLNNGRAQSFFKLGDNVDFASAPDLVIPPIGTYEYPFIGNFDGNGKVVSNLKVSNKQTDLKIRPSSAKFTESSNQDGILKTDNNSYQVSIVGFFGIIGDHTYKNGETFSTFVENNYENNGIDVKDNTVSLPAAVNENEFYKSAMEVSGFYLNDLAVTSGTEQTLVGLVAGYVGATVENTGVYRAAVNLASNAKGIDGSSSNLNFVDSSKNTLNYGTTVSKYSLIGDYDENIVQWSEKPVGAGGDSSGGDEGAGFDGSIDIRTLNRRLNYMFSLGDIEKSGTVRRSSSAVFNTQLYTTLGNTEFYWNARSSTNEVMYLQKGTYIPLNVDQIGMKLKNKENGTFVINEAEITIDGLHVNEEYANFDTDNKPKPTGEIILDNNTGYIVGGGTEGSSSVRANIRQIGSSLYLSLGKTSSTASASYNGSSFEIIGFQMNSSKNAEQYRISTGYTGSSALSSKVPNAKTVQDLDLIKYTHVKGKFDTTMQGISILHGIRFYTNPNTRTSGKVKMGKKEYTDYQLQDGGINFKLTESGYITAILGAYNGGRRGFNLYKLTRNSQNEITEMQEIKAVYTDKNGGIYYEKIDAIPNDAKLTFTFNESFTGSNTLVNNAAYYVEIPAKIGDYFITSESAYSAYLMYLDIGANGDGSTGGETPAPTTTPYKMETVDFVTTNEGTEDFSVPTTDLGTPFYPSYKDVTVLLSDVQNGESSVEYARNPYADTVDLSKTDETPIDTTLKVTYRNITCTITPAELGEKTEKSQ